VRPYLENPQMSCNGCNIIRLYRSMHCPVCKTCIAKHTRHSIIFGICIGAANELLSLLFFLSLFATECYLLYLFLVANSYGFITKLMFYLLNISICWLSFVEFATLLILVRHVLYRILDMESLNSRWKCGQCSSIYWRRQNDNLLIMSIKGLSSI